MRFFLLLLILLFLPSPAQCGMIEVRPTLLVVTPSQRIAVLSLVNPEARPTIYQIRAYRWRQNGDEQVLEPTEDVIASPPMVSLAGHSNQIVRVGLRSSTIPPDEQTYRLILEEVPTGNAPDQPGLNISLRLSFPLFVRPEQDLPPEQLTGDLRISGNDAVVTIRNKGRFTTRIGHAVLTTPAAPDDKKTELNKLTYILPGAWASFRFALASMPPSFRDASVNLQTDEGSLDLETPLVSEVAPDAPTAVVH